MKVRNIVVCGLVGLAVSPVASAQGWFAECWDLSAIPPVAQYSPDYGINGVANVLFGATMGVSGTSRWGSAVTGLCTPLYPGTILNASGRLSFFMGGTGSVQSNFDDDMALSMGAPTDPVGDFCYVRITKDTNEPGTSVLFGNGGLDLAFVGVSKRYMVGTWSDADVDVKLTVRNIGDAAILWWDIRNLGTDPRPLGMLFAIWGAEHTNGAVDTQSVPPSDAAFALQNFNFATVKVIPDNFVPWTGFFVTPTTRPIRTDHHFLKNSTRFPAWVEYLFGQTEDFGMHLTNTPDASMSKISYDPVHNVFSGATSVDSIRIGDFFWTSYQNNIRMNVFGDTTGIAEEADVSVLEHAVVQRYPVVVVGAGQVRRVIQVIKSNWGVSNYNDPYAAVLDAPKLVNYDPAGQDHLSPNPMTIRAYIDNQFARIDRDITLSQVRFILTLPSGLSLVAGQTSEKTVNAVGPNAVRFVDWQVESDGTTFGDLPISVTIVPTPGPQKVLSTTIRIASTPRIRIAANAQMVSFPYEFPDNSLGAVLGLQQDVDFHAYKWDPGQSAYIPASTANRGESVWIVPTVDEGFIDLQNASIPGDTPTGGLLYTLHKGWNMIGNPYNNAVPLSELVAVVDDAPQDSFTWAEIVSLGFVSSALATWDRGPSGDGPGSYKFTTSQASKLEPHKGYWIFVNTFNDIHLSWPPVLIPGLANSGRAADPDEDWQQTERKWRLQLAARTSDGSDLTNYVGYVADSGKLGKLTLPKPPTSPSMTVEMVIEGTMNGQTARLAQAMTDKKTKTEFHVHVNNAAAGDVTVTWPNLPSIPRNVRAKLTDLATGEVRDLWSVSGYTFFASQPGSREFVISLEQGGSSRPVIGNVVVSSPGRGIDQIMTVSYALSADALVSVRILSGTGKEVYAVTRGRADSAGENQVNWNLRDSANRAVAPGTYRVEILAETPNGERVRKMVPINVVR